MHTRRFKLEHGNRISGLENLLVRVLIIALHVLNVRTNAGVLFDVVERTFNNRQRGQTKEVELHQTYGFHVLFVIHTDDVFRQHACCVERTEINQFARCNQHAARVNAQASGGAFQFQGVLNEFAGLRIVANFSAELRLFAERFFKGRVVTGARRNHAGKAISLGIRHIENTADILNDALGTHRTEGRNLAHGLFAVLGFHVLNHASAVVLAEVHVKVRHGHTFRIQKAFEQQVVRKRIQVGNTQAVSHQGTGTRTAARTHRTAVGLGPVNKVLHDEEVTREVHVLNDLDLTLQAFLVARELCFAFFLIRI